jgi:hypothetical protein
MKISRTRDTKYPEIERRRSIPISPEYRRLTRRLSYLALDGVIELWEIRFSVRYRAVPPALTCSSRVTD